MVKKKKSKLIYVGDLGESIMVGKNQKGALDVHRVRDYEGGISWMLNPDEVRGDVVLKSAKVIPIQQDVMKDISYPHKLKALKSLKRRRIKLI